MRYGVLCPSFSFWGEFHNNRRMPGMIAFCASWRYFERNSLFFSRIYANFTPVAIARHPFGKS